jgi:formate dehydrogenase subunit beta
MTKALKINKSTEEGLLEFIKFLLENKKIKGFFSLKKIDEKGIVAYSLITDIKDLKDTVPFYPIMPVNAGKLLSRFTLKGAPDGLVAAVVKPCELRGFIELIKREQGSFDNLLIISSTCGGVYPTKFQVDDQLEKNLSNYWDSVKNCDVINNTRPICRSCEEFLPYSADITVDLIGNSNLDKQCVMYLNSKQGEEIAKFFEGNISDKNIDNKKLDELRNKRGIEKKKLFDEIDKKMSGIDGLIDIFGKCISCHGCMRVCPICYCTLCEFESSDVEYKPSNYESELKKRKGVRVPPGTVFFHVGRMLHMGMSCVACGACDDVCPVDIPVSMIFKKVGESIQKMFDYLPGKNVDDDIPLLTFEKNEFIEVEE